MVTVTEPNVYNIAIDGSFDDCQLIMKSTFDTLEFKDKYHLGTINSINFARILAQITYYFSAYFQVLLSACSPPSEEVTDKGRPGQFG